MTASEHVYTAFLIGSPDVELAVSGGRVSLDAGSSPHVTASIDVAVPGTWGLDAGVPVFTPDAETLLALDPREDARIRLEVDATYPASTQHREFNLGLRRRSVNHNDGTLTLDLSSDEALLEDYAPLADDTTPRTHEASLRAVVNYVLSKVGASLEATPANDADVTAAWEVSNLLSNPSFNTDATGWRAGGTASGVVGGNTGVTPPFPGGYCTITAGGAGYAYVVLDDPQRATPKQLYTFSAHMRSVATARDWQVIIRWFDAAGNLIRSNTANSAAVPSASWRRVSVTAAAPVNADTFDVLAGFNATGAGNQGHVDACMFNEGPLTSYVDGSLPDNTYYAFDWDDTAVNGTSTRIPFVERDPEMFRWRAGQSAMDFLHPLVQASGYRLVCDENRDWTLRSADYSASGSVTFRHAVNLIQGEDAIDRASGLWYDAAVTEYTWVASDGTTKTKTDSYALTMPYTRLRKFEKNAPWPGPGFSEYAVNRAQQRGREVTASAVSNWRAKAEQNATVLFENAPIQTGRTERIEYDLSNDEMTATLRTTDTPELAWVLGPDDLHWDDVAPALTWAAMDDWSDA